MNNTQATELLREDEKGFSANWGTQLELLRQRLIEEREKNKRLYEKKFHPRIAELEAELAEAREKNAELERESALARKHCNDNYDAANLERKRAETAEAELAEAQRRLKVCEDYNAKLVLELSEARKIIREGIDPVCDCDWCCQTREYVARLNTGAT